VKKDGTIVAHHLDFCSTAAPCFDEAGGFDRRLDLPGRKIDNV
jgi:hypothetical protein